MAERKVPLRRKPPVAVESPLDRKRREMAARAATVQVEYVDDTGRRWAVLVPVGHEDEAAQGVVVGPPDVRVLGWPEDVALRVHNELYVRRILTMRDARTKAAEIGAALAAALRADIQTVQALYREEG